MTRGSKARAREVLKGAYGTTEWNGEANDQKRDLRRGRN